MESRPALAPELLPVVDEVFLARFPRYLRTAVRLRHLPLEHCRREAEDIRGEGLMLFLEACLRAGESSPDRDHLRRLAVRSLARACYSCVERSLRRPVRPLPPGARARDARPDEWVERKEIRRLVRHSAPRIGDTLLRTDCLHTTGRLNKAAVQRAVRVSRRGLERELGGIRRALRTS